MASAYHRDGNEILTVQAPIAGPALFFLPGEPAPEDAHLLHVTAAGGVRLRVALFPATVPVPRGTVLLLQGRAEYIEKYLETIADLRRMGFAVVTFDWRGQGGSDRLVADRIAGHVGGFSAYERDLRAVLKELKRHDLPRPLVGLAHSMGGAVLLLAARRLRGVLDRLVLSAPLVAFGPAYGSIARTDRQPGRAAAFLVDLVAGIGFSGRMLPGRSHPHDGTAPFAGNLLTGDAGRFARAIAHERARPDLMVGRPTFGWVRAAVVAIEHLARPGAAERIALPVLIVTGGADRVVSNRAAEAFAMRLPLGATLMIPGARHELMMERDGPRGDFLAALDGFCPPVSVKGRIAAR